MGEITIALTPEKGIAMNVNDFVKQQWTQTLRTMLRDYRYQFPEDTRSDKDVLHDLMKNLVQTGMIQVTADGKLSLPTIFENSEPV